MRFYKLAILLAVSFTGLSSVVQAGSSSFSGPLNTLGKVSTRQTLLSATVNPAAGEYVVANKYRWSYLSGVGFGFEIGELDDLSESFDDLMDELDRLEQKADDLFQFVTLGEVVAVQDQFDEFLIELGKKGTALGEVQSRVPGFPLAFRSELVKGVITLDARLGLEFNAVFIDSPLEIILPTIVDPNYRLTTDTALLLNTAELEMFSLAYSHDLNNSLFKGESNAFTRNGGRLLLGTQLNFYKATMSSQLIAIDQPDENEDLADLIIDEFDNNQVDSSDFGLDLGILWVNNQFQLGATWVNINEPVFESTNLGQVCSSISSPTLQKNCQIALSLAASGLLDPSPEYVLENQLSIEGAVSTVNKHWSFAASFDLNEVEGLDDEAYQWLAGSVSYFSNSLWIPSARIGYRSNLSGSKLDFASFGLTFLGGSHLDFSMALDSIDVDGSDFPRALAVNFGFERRF